MFMHCDLHVHTFLSPCGETEMNPAAIVRAAEAQGIRHLAVTDHIHRYSDISILDRVRWEFDWTGKKSMNIYIGCEADILAVGESVIDERLASKVDFVMASANHFNDHCVSKPQTNSRKDVARHFLDMFNYAVSIEAVDVIAHPFYVMPDTFDPLSPAELTEEDLIPSIELAAKNRTAVEISRRALTRAQRPFLTFFYRLCKEAGLKFAVGNDAHRLLDVGKTRIIEPIIRELNLTDEDLWLPNGGR